MIEKKYMYRCLELAQQAEGLTYPNPMVGAVIVHNNKIIGEGYHKKNGDDHAEVIAIKSVTDKNMLKNSFCKNAAKIIVFFYVQNNFFFF
jgi:diaminohydroxyphosphoribosylaminopyrimidine deaminase/5-amino-6-(5-phosphoribosylamino)uracil reductase